MDISMFDSCEVCITTVTKQARKHKKRRTNKKWLKRYGLIQHDVQKHGAIVQCGNVLYMSKSTFNDLKEEIENERKRNNK